MVTAVQTAQEKLPITGFNSEGYPVYPTKLHGHFLWDTLGPGNCDLDCACWDNWEEDYIDQQRKKKLKKKKPKTRVHITNLNHLIIHLHHQLLYPSIKRNLNGLQNQTPIHYSTIHTTHTAYG